MCAVASLFIIVLLAESSASSDASCRVTKILTTELMAGRHTSSTIKIRESSIQHQRASALHVLDTDVVEDGRDSPEAIIGVHVSNFMRLN